MRTGWRAGLSLVETVVGLALFAGLVGLVTQNLRFHQMAGRLVEKLDVIQQVRLAELRLAGDLGASTAILHPPPGAGPAVPGMVFAGPDNVLHVLYLDPAGAVRLKADGKPSELLVEGVRALAVRQPRPGQVECLLTADSPERGRLSFVLAGAVGCSLLGSGVRP